ncbi:MAG: NYN domain-containing protein [Eubacteriales bacterium]|nr:NYN domain-containing protein [Eubacteriales bacterium]
MKSYEDQRLALLIDADNISYKYIKSIIGEVANYGTPTYKRIYGDWTQPTLSGWKPALLENAITPVQQYSYTTGKNSTDSALIIDAMDILYSQRVDGFCIVSSDSDFTRLAVRLREAGMTVIGMGEKKTPNAFISACERFIYLEVLNPSATAKAPVRTETTRVDPEAARVEPDANKNVANLDPDSVSRLIASVAEDAADEDGWAFLGKVGNILNKLHPDFDARNYGCRNLTQLVASIPNFAVDERQTADPHVKLVYIREKRAR